MRKRKKTLEFLEALPSILSEDFGEIVATRRHDLGYTQKYVADSIGCSPGSISYIERSMRRTLPYPWMFWRLARVLELQPAEMLEAAGYLK